jgi:hypothetical protein
LNETENDEFIARLSQLCEITKSDNLFNMIWLLYCSDKYKYYYAPTLRRYKSSLFISKESKKKSLTHFRENESHSEIIEQAIYQSKNGIPEIEAEAWKLYENLIFDVTFLTKMKRIVKFFV